MNLAPTFCEGLVFYIIIAIFYFLLRLPIDDQLYRKQWIDQISKIQPFSHNGQYQICHMHFYKNDLFCLNGKYKLRGNAIPKIFENVSPGTTEDVQCEIFWTQ